MVSSLFSSRPVKTDMSRCAHGAGYLSGILRVQPDVNDQFSAAPQVRAINFWQCVAKLCLRVPGPICYVPKIDSFVICISTVD